MVVILGQKIILGLSPEESETADTTLNITDTQVTFADLGGTKPQVDAENCMASVSTFSHLM